MRFCVWVVLSWAELNRVERYTLVQCWMFCCDNVHMDHTIDCDGDRVRFVLNLTLLRFASLPKRYFFVVLFQLIKNTKQNKAKPEKNNQIHLWITTWEQFSLLLSFIWSVGRLVGCSSIAAGFKDRARSMGIYAIDLCAFPIRISTFTYNR